MNELELHRLPKILKLYLASFVIALAIGVTIGLVYLYETTKFDKETTIERYSGAQIEVEEDFGIVENGGKTKNEILMTVHNHIISFSTFFFLMGILFYFSTTLKGFIKKIILFEPMISILFSFGSLLAVKFISPIFIYITLISATFMYSGFFLMVFILLKDLLFTNSDL